MQISDAAGILRHIASSSLVDSLGGTHVLAQSFILARARECIDTKGRCDPSDLASELDIDPCIVQQTLESLKTPQCVFTPSGELLSAGFLAKEAARAAENARQSGAVSAEDVSSLPGGITRGILLKAASIVSGEIVDGVLVYPPVLDPRIAELCVSRVSITEIARAIGIPPRAAHASVARNITSGLAARIIAGDVVPVEDLYRAEAQVLQKLVSERAVPIRLLKSTILSQSVDDWISAYEKPVVVFAECVVEDALLAEIAAGAGAEIVERGWAEITLSPGARGDDVWEDVCKRIGGRVQRIDGYIFDEARIASTDGLPRVVQDWVDRNAPKKRQEEDRGRRIFVTTPCEQNEDEWIAVCSALEATQAFDGALSQLLYATTSDSMYSDAVRSAQESDNPLEALSLAAKRPLADTTKYASAVMATLYDQIANDTPKTNAAFLHVCIAWACQRASGCVFARVSGRGVPKMINALKTAGWEGDLVGKFDEFCAFVRRETRDSQAQEKLRVLRQEIRDVIVAL